MTKVHFKLANLLVFIFFTFNSLFAQQPSEVGQWSDPIPFGIVPVAVANLPDGKLIAWSSKYRDNFGGADGFTFTEIFDPFEGPNGTAMGETTSTTNHDMFCPGINNLPNGQLLVSGGSSNPKATLYDYKTSSWIPIENMNVGRGYQGNVTLPDGSAMTFGGSWSGGLGPNGEKIAEVWRPETGWKTLPGLKSDILWNINDANLENQGVYRLDNHAWLWAAPNGKVFHAGPSEDMHWLDTSGVGSSTSVGKRGNDNYSMKGTTVMYDIGKILKVGGANSYSSGDPAKDNSYVIDINDENNVLVVPTQNNLSFSRTMHNSVVLPNGEVLVTGGLSTAQVFTDSGARLNAEMYNPTTNRWRTVAGMQVPRTYHSVSILQADGRVFVGGGGLCGSCTNHMDAEIYSPPYLFDASGNLAQRPVIDAPEEADYNSNLAVTGTVGIQEFSLIRLSSATHSTNNEQRRIPVTFSGNGSYNLSIPNRNLLPPGFYMLFAIDSNGVPSIAQTIKVGDYIPVDRDANLVLDLKFDETNGVNVTDASVFGNNAVIKERDNNRNEVTPTQNYRTNDGLFGSAMEMDGREFESNSIVEVPFSASMATVKSEITVMAWVYRDEIEYNVAILAHDYPKLFFGFHNSLYKWEFPTSDGGSVNCYSGYSPSNKWVHIAATFDGEVGKLYANGVEICSDLATGEITFLETGGTQSAFTTSGFYDRHQAASLSGVTDELDGRIDELKVFNTALIASEIDQFYQLGVQQLNPEVPECSDNSIVAEYKIGVDGQWQQGTSVTVDLGAELFIRANVSTRGEYFVTLPYNQQNRFSSVTDFPNFQDTTAYKIDTFIGNGDGIFGANNYGQYVLTTASGCVTAIDVKADSNCPTGSVIPEYQINGVWMDGQNVVEVEEGDILVLSALPNGNNYAITNEEGNNFPDNYSLGAIDTSKTGVYTIRNQFGCSTTIEIRLPSNESCDDLAIAYTINNAPGSGETEITVTEGDNISLFSNLENVEYIISGPDGIILENNSLDGISIDEAGIYTLTATLGGSPDIDPSIIFVDSEEVSAENGRSINVLDGNPESIWHTEWSTSETPYPHEIQIDLGYTSNITGLEYLPRQLGTINGTIAQYEIYVSISTSNWGTAVSTGTWGNNRNLKTVNFPEKEGRYIRLVALSEVNGNPWASAAEINVIKSVEIECSKTIVINVESVNILVENVVLDRTAASLELGEELVLTATVSPINATNKSVTWSSSNTDIATVDDTGLVTALSEGIATISVSTTDGNFIATSEITVERLPISVTGVEVSPKTASLNIGNTIVIVADVFPSNADNKSIIWTSTDDAVISVDSNGQVTGISEGSAKIIVETLDGGFTAESNISVEINTIDVTGVEVNPSTLSMEVGSTTVLNATVLPANATNASVSWSSDNESVATVDENGLVSGISDGTTTITVTAEDGGFTAEVVVIISEIGCASIGLVAEYNISGTGYFEANGPSITASAGDWLILSVLPNGLEFSIEGPNGNNKSMGFDDISISDIGTADAGIYTFTTLDGCQTTLELILEDVPSDCATIGLVAEYNISGTGYFEANGPSIILSEGDWLILSVLPNNQEFSIAGPNGNSKSMGFDDLTLFNITTVDMGIYTFTTRDGCETALELILDDTTEDCASIGLIPEYNISGNGYFTSNSAITLIEGDWLILSISPNDRDFSITGPNDNNKPLSFDDMTLFDLSINDAGTYTFTTEGGCQTSLEVIVEMETIDCTVDSLENEYSLDGIWTSGQSVLELEEGTEVVLSALPNFALGKEVVYTITDPNGNSFGDDYNLGLFSPLKTGVYTITSEFGCSTTLELQLKIDANGLIGTTMNTENEVREVTVFPNPTSGILNLNLNKYAGQQVLITVVSTSQQEVYSKSFSEKHNLVEEIDVTNLANGVYYIMFKSNGSSESQTFILTK